MDHQARNASRALEGVLRPLAEWTVSSHAEAHPDLPERYGPGWRDDWLAQVSAILRHLAQAVALQYPPLFSEAVAWGRQAFGARHGRVEDVNDSLLCLKEVLRAELPESVADLAVPCVDAALTATPVVTVDQDVTFDAATECGQLIVAYLAALLEGRSDDAIAIIVGAARAGTAVPTLMEEVLQPALQEIGLMWHRGDISIADEHHATLTTHMSMSLLRPYFPQVAPMPRRMIAVGVGGEAHDVGVRMVADMFTMAGWTALCLGSNIPDDDIIEAVVRQSAHLVALSAATTLTLRAVAELIDALRATPDCADLPIIVGGAAFSRFPDLWQVLGADGSATSASAAVDLGQSLCP